MTNEEKAKEISNWYGNTILCDETYKSALRMAEWKDHQFKEYMEKKREEDHPYWNGCECLGAESIINEIINEFFGI